MLGTAFGYRDLTECTLRTVALVSHLSPCLETALELIHARAMMVLALEEHSNTSHVVDHSREPRNRCVNVRPRMGHPASRRPLTDPYEGPRMRNKVPGG